MTKEDFTGLAKSFEFGKFLGMQKFLYQSLKKQAEKEKKKN